MPIADYSQQLRVVYGPTLFRLGDAIRLGIPHEVINIFWELKAETQSGIMIKTQIPYQNK